MKPWKNRSLNNLSSSFNKQIRVEAWVYIADFEELYMINSFGRVKSLKRTKSIIRKGYPVNLYIKERIIAQFLDGGGYPGFKICKDGITYWFHTHRTVGIHFIPNPNNLPEINHQKGDKEDNRKWKLEWTTKK